MANKIYFYRHQAEGVLYSKPFASEPTAEQLAALDKLMLFKHGQFHPKEASKPDGEERATYWSRVESFNLIDAVEVIDSTPPSLSVVSEAEAPRSTVSGVGTVTPKGSA